MLTARERRIAAIIHSSTPSAPPTVQYACTCRRGHGANRDKTGGYPCSTGQGPLKKQFVSGFRRHQGAPHDNELHKPCNHKGNIILPCGGDYNIPIQNSPQMLQDKQIIADSRTPKPSTWITTTMLLGSYL